MSARAARRLQRGQFDQAAVRIRVTASLASRQQPVDSAGVDRQFTGIPRSGAAIGRQLDAHHVALGRQRDANRCARRSSTAGANPARRHQRHAQRVLQRGGIGSYRLDIVGHDQGATHVPILGMMLEQRQCRTHAVDGHQGFEIGFGPSRQLPQLLQQTVQTVGIDAQSGEHPFVGDTRRIEERGNGRDGRHAVAESMCQPTQQIVMYREPTLRSRGDAHV